MLSLNLKSPPKSSAPSTIITECRRRYLTAKIMDSLQFYPDLLKDDELEELWMRAQTIEQCAYTQAAASGSDSFNREEYYSLIRAQSSLVSPVVETKFIKMEPLSVQIGTEQQSQDSLEVTKSDQKDEAKSPNSGKIFQRIRSQVQKFWSSSAKDFDTEDQQFTLNQNLIDTDIISNYSNNSFALTDDEPAIYFNFNIIPQDLNQQKHMQRQLILILHAHKCNEKQKLSSTPINCPLPYCPKMQGVLKHMTTCRSGSDCTYHHCQTSRQIIVHWRDCNIEKCPICLPVKNSKSSKGKSKEQPRGNTISPLSSILKKSPRQNEKEEEDLKEFKNTLTDHLVVWETNGSPFSENDSMSDEMDDKEEDEHSKTLINENSLCLRKSVELSSDSLTLACEKKNIFEDN